MKKISLILLGALFILITGCSDHGHGHDQDKSTPIKHDTLK